MRIVALEEHFAVPSLVRRIDPEAITRFGFPPGFGGPLADSLSDLGSLRLSEMDEAGITVDDIDVHQPSLDPRGRVTVRAVILGARLTHADRIEQSPGLKAKRKT